MRGPVEASLPLRRASTRSRPSLLSSSRASPSLPSWIFLASLPILSRVSRASLELMPPWRSWSVTARLKADRRVCHPPDVGCGDGEFGAGAVDGLCETVGDGDGGADGVV